MQRISEVLAEAGLPERLPQTSSIAYTPDAPVCPMCQGAGWLVMRDLPLGHPDWCKLVACECGKVIKERMTRMDEALGFEWELKDVDWKAIRPLPQQQDMVSAVRAFIEHPQGWLYLYGPFGDGKTTMLALAVNMLRGRKWEAIFANVPQTLRYLRSCIASTVPDDYETVLDYIRRVPMLGLDDLGAQKWTEWATEQLYEVLNYRYVKSKPTIITSNLGPTELGDGRLASRLSDVALVKVVECGEGDVRRMQR